MTRDPRVVLVTGASSGIGREACLHAARRGDHLVLVARGRGRLEAVAAECRAAGAASAAVYPADVGLDDEVAGCVRAAHREHGRLDLVVHSAGVAAYGRTESIPVEVVDGVLRTNLGGALNVARHVVPVLREQGQGSLVLVGSLLGQVAVPTMTPYVVSKWGVHALARQLVLENRDLPGVDIRILTPGGVDTPIYARAAAYGGFLGRPPPPVATAARVGRAAVEAGAGLGPVTGLATRVVRLGYAVTPRLYDALVGPLFRRAATDRRVDVAPTPGNVLAR